MGIAGIVIAVQALPISFEFKFPHGREGSPPSLNPRKWPRARNVPGALFLRVRDEKPQPKAGEDWGPSTTHTRQCDEHWQLRLCRLKLMAPFQIAGVNAGRDHADIVAQTVPPASKNISLGSVHTGGKILAERTSVALPPNSHHAARSERPAGSHRRAIFLFSGA
jgi:hypothetical protein